MFIMYKVFTRKYWTPMTQTPVTLRKPEATDGFALNELVERCKPLDTNSVYCNLLQCSDFRDTAIAALTDEGDLVGFISGYRPPARSNTLFVWQVAVDSRMRGQGLALKMLMTLVKRVAAEGVDHIETTISPGNEGSEALFKKAFRELGAEYETSVLFSSATHFNGHHDDEVLYRAGPFAITTA
ncbi:L-2,4-diaminobutyric acid acetyltransferase [Halopseudomonas salina]|uniref:L-2,4-diaminobutyric acid acetyltransferase n=2 Tax=Halopseudomonas salina TaxID=1323744 RepID=A0ABQ1PKW5_9GAMM|nr:L-2,4-diaminobutyric acid acetyltransferase [Halopseudomonas salina]